MLGRMREALFSILTPWTPDAAVLDLFAGSGSLGLEALSRGAREARLVEQDPAALEALRANVAHLHLGERARVVAGDALEPAAWGAGAYDVVFFDPPYALLRGTERASVFAAVKELTGERLAPEGVLVFHAPRKEVQEDELGAGLLVRERSYGTGSLWFLQAAEPGAGADHG